MAHRQRVLGVGQRRQLVAGDRDGRATSSAWSGPRRGGRELVADAQPHARDSGAASHDEDLRHVGEHVGRGGRAGHAVGQLGEHLVGRRPGRRTPVVAPVARHRCARGRTRWRRLPSRRPRARCSGPSRASSPEADRQRQIHEPDERRPARASTTARLSTAGADSTGTARRGRPVPSINEVCAPGTTCLKGACPTLDVG